MITFWFTGIHFLYDQYECQGPHPTLYYHICPRVVFTALAERVAQDLLCNGSDPLFVLHRAAAVTFSCKLFPSDAPSTPCSTIHTFPNKYRQDSTDKAVLVFVTFGLFFPGLKTTLKHC